jgi:polyisoprenoid-binding protein YceI
MKNNLMSVMACFAFTLLFTACSNEAPEEQEKQSCTYTFDQSSSLLEWTAYKFTDKTPVKGSFNEIQFDGLPEADDAKKLIESLSFVIQTASVETQNEERNGKIAKLFFGTIGTMEIVGKVKSLANDGSAVVAITMNKQTKDVRGKYTLDGELFTFTASINVVDWSASDAIQALNTACKDLHTGKDGVSKLWTEVGLSFTTTLKKSCK